MDERPDSTEGDDLLQRYGRRLFVLAYHLTGDAAASEDLSQECLVRGLLAPDFPADPREAGIVLHRALITLWKERLEVPGPGGPRPLAGGASAGRGQGPAGDGREHAALWRALSRLDPVSRAVFVLRVAAGAGYETIGRVLDMAPDVVYARLLQARAGLRANERPLETSLFETMNLYLDGRLPGEQRGAFERRIQTDVRLRENVEFHRGLTLDLHEEAPALPRDFARRLQERLERARETLALVDRAAEEIGWQPGPGREGGAAALPKAAGREAAFGALGEATPRRSISLATALLVVGAVIALLAAGFWAGRRLPASATRTAPGAPGGTPAPAATPDEATIEALRSLGYLAPAKEKSRAARGKPTPNPATTPAGKAAAGPKATAGSKQAPVAAPPPTATPPAATPSPTAPIAPPSAAATPAPATEAPAGAVAPSPDAAATPAPAAPAEQGPGAAPRSDAGAAGAGAPQTPLSWRVRPAGRGPEPGRDHLVIRTPQEWAALFGGAEAPPLSFEGEMAILLRSDLGDDPPARLVVASVRSEGGAIVVECRREPVPPGGTAAAGQAVLVPRSDLPVRIVVVPTSSG